MRWTSCATKSPSAGCSMSSPPVSPTRRRTGMAGSGAGSAGTASLQAAGTLAAVAVATVVAVGIGSSAGGVAPDTGPRVVPAWALPWPDHRNGSVPQSVLDGAVRCLATLRGPGRHDRQARHRMSKTIWYVGQKVANGEVVVVIFEAATNEGRQAGRGMGNCQRGHARPAGLEARIESVGALRRRGAEAVPAGLFVGLNTHGTSASAWPQSGQLDNRAG